MITQRRQTYACHVDIDSFMVLYVYFDPKILKSSLQCNLKEAMFSPLIYATGFYRIYRRPPVLMH